MTRSQTLRAGVTRCDEVLSPKSKRTQELRHIVGFLLLSLLLTGAEAPCWAAGPGKPGASGQSTAAGPEQNRLDPLTPIRLLMEQKFWEEARRGLQELSEQPEADPVEGALLLAEVCYQTLDLSCTVAALGQARSHANAETLEKVAALETLVHTRVGRVHLILDPPGPVKLVRDEPLLDLHLQRLVERARLELQTLPRGWGKPFSGGRQGSGPPSVSGDIPAVAMPRRVTRWLDPVSRAELSGPAPGQALLELWLPVGGYQLEGRAVTVTGGTIQPLLLRRAHAAPPRRTVSVTLLGTGSSGATDAGFLPHAGMELSLRGTRGWGGPLLSLGMASHLEQPDLESEGGLRPTLQLGVHGSLSPRTWLRLEPELSGRVSLYPARRLRCEHDAVTRNYLLSEGYCTTELASASALLGLTAALHLSDWRIALEGQGGAQLLVPMEPGILGSMPQYRFDGLPAMAGLALVSVGIGRWRATDVLIENARRRRLPSSVLSDRLVIRPKGGQ